MDYPEDCVRIVAAALANGLMILPEQAEEIWAARSEAWSAGWLVLPKDQEALWAEMKDYVAHIKPPTTPTHDEVIERMAREVHAFYCEGESDESCDAITAQCADIMRAAIHELGMVIVPREPTEEMIEAGHEAVANRWIDFVNRPDLMTPTLSEIFCAMTTAYRGEKT